MSHIPRVTLRPYRTQACLDLGVLYFQRHLWVMLSIGFAVALPAALLIWLGSTWWQLDGWFAAGIVFLASAAVSLLVIDDTVWRAFDPAGIAADKHQLNAGRWGLMFAMALPVGGAMIANQVAGYLKVSESTQRLMTGMVVAPGLLLLSLRIMGTVGYQVSLQTLALRCVCAVGPLIMCLAPSGWATAAGFLLCLWPGLWMGLRGSFLIERIAFTRLGPSYADTQFPVIVRRESGDLLIKSIQMLSFYLVVVGTLFITFDALAHLVFQRSIFLPRLVIQTEPLPYAWRLLTSDPLVMTVLAAIALVTWPIVRMAWFFQLVDARVRRDCWDLQLEFLQTLTQLKETRPRG